MLTFSYFSLISWYMGSIYYFFYSLFNIQVYNMFLTISSPVCLHSLHLTIWLCILLKFSYVGTNTTTSHNWRLLLLYASIILEHVILVQSLFNNTCLLLLFCIRLLFFLQSSFIMCFDRLPVKTLQLEQMAVMGSAEEPSVVASRMRLVFSTLEVQCYILVVF